MGSNVTVMWRESRRLATRGSTFDYRTLRTLLAAMAVALLSVVTLAAPPASAYPGPTTNVFDPVTTNTRFVFDRTEAQWASDFATYTSQGFMVLDLEVSNIGGLRYAAVFQSKPSGVSWRSLRDMSPSEFDTENARSKAAGLRISDFEAYVKNGAATYAAVWVSAVVTSDAVLVKNKTFDQMDGLVAQQRSNNHMPVDLEEYSVPGCQHCYASI